MVEEKNIASSSRPKKSKLLENVRTPSNLRCSLRRPIHQFEFSNTVDDPIKVEEMEDPSKSSEQDAFGEEASSKEGSKYISSALDSKTETVEDSLDERATVIEESQYEPTSFLPLVYSPSFSFFFIFHPAIYFPFL